MCCKSSSIGIKFSRIHTSAPKMHSVFSLLYTLRADDNERVRGEWLGALGVSLIGPARAELPHVNGTAARCRPQLHIPFASLKSPQVVLDLYSTGIPRPLRDRGGTSITTRSITCSKPHRHRRLSFACKRRTPLNSKTLSPPPATCHQQSSIDLVRCGLPRTSCPVVTSSPP